MDFPRLSADLKDLRRRNAVLGVAVGAMAAALVLALAVILCLLGTQRTVVVPPAIDRSFWVARDSASSAYLEQMAAFVAWLVLDVTPSSIDWKKDVLLGYVEPDQHGALKTRQELEAARLKRINASTSRRRSRSSTASSRRAPSQASVNHGPESLQFFCGALAALYLLDR